MKKILITGVNSYIGTSLANWLKMDNDRYSIDMISIKDNLWKEKDFSRYDVVFHVAGLAHVSTDPRMEALYYKVNRDITIEICKKAKRDGVRQFIFMSSIIVYADSGSINQKRIIDKNTVPDPTNFYGKSKLQAEQGIMSLQDDSFKVVIIRAPMIYGKGSKGNYSRLAKIARKLPVFPDIDNERSMLHIDNLCEFIRVIIKNVESGIFYPQNKEYIKTSEMVRLIAEIHDEKIKLTRIFNPVLRFLGKRIGIVNKVFGNLVYEKSMSEYKENYRIRDLKESIIATEVVNDGK